MKRKKDAIKRSADVCSVLLASPIILALAAAIGVLLLAIQGRPVLFRQLRIGRDGMPFNILKFRTMNQLSGPDGILRPDSERITRCGAVLRSLSLDELPQAWNVLRGDMSIVGPRPLPIEYRTEFTSRQMLRHSVRPGLTGLAQVRGRNSVDWETRLEIDVNYVEHHSLLLDLRVLLMTLPLVMSGRGVSAPGQATMPMLRGKVE